jgi:dephospho-CoA kinase
VLADLEDAEGTAMYLIGLTGGIGSGKSEVARRLSELGARVIEADQVARELTSPGSETLDAIRDAFGESVIRADGTLDRSRLAGIAFGSEEQLETLNRITWPPLKSAIIRNVEQVAREDPECVLVVDAALLVQWDMLDLFDRVVAVTAPEELRISRVAGSGRFRDDVASRIRAQLPESALIVEADTVIENDGTLDELRRRVDELWRSLPVDYSGEEDQ